MTNFKLEFCCFHLLNKQVKSKFAQGLTLKIAIRYFLAAWNRTQVWFLIKNKSLKMSRNRLKTVGAYSKFIFSAMEEEAFNYGQTL
jgi:hypothetical protein